MSTTATIADPYYGNVQGFEQALDYIEDLRRRCSSWRSDAQAQPPPEGLVQSPAGEHALGRAPPSGGRRPREGAPFFGASGPDR